MTHSYPLGGIIYGEKPPPPPVRFSSSSSSSSSTTIAASTNEKNNGIIKKLSRDEAMMTVNEQGRFFGFGNSNNVANKKTKKSKVFSGKSKYSYLR